MSVVSVVSNSSPLIALEQIGSLTILKQLFRHIIVPPAVAREIAPTLSVPDWITIQAPVQSVGTRILHPTLGPGESEAISLAVEVSPQFIILDDRPARRLAERLGLAVVGTLGLLVVAKQKGYITAVRPAINALLSTGFFIAPELIGMILAKTGEEI